MAWSVIRATNCDHCKECLITSEAIETLDTVDEFEYSVSTFLDAVNQGGLHKPTDFTFLLALHQRYVDAANADVSASFLQRPRMDVDGSSLKIHRCGLTRIINSRSALGKLTHRAQ